MIASMKPPSRRGSTTCTGVSRARCRRTTRGCSASPRVCIRSTAVASSTSAAARAGSPGAPRSRGERDRSRRLRGDARRGGGGLDRVRRSARRLPSAVASFDAVIAVEVFEHLAPRAVDDVCAEVRRVLVPGGSFVVVDKNLYSLNAQRPWLPSATVNGSTNGAGDGCIRTAGRSASDGSGRPACAVGCCDGSPTSASSTCSRGARRVDSRSSKSRPRDCWSCGTPRRREGSHDERYSPIPASLPLLLWRTPLASSSSSPRKACRSRRSRMRTRSRSAADGSSSSMDAPRPGIARRPPDSGPGRDRR